MSRFFALVGVGVGKSIRAGCVAIQAERAVHAGYARLLAGSQTIRSQFDQPSAADLLSEPAVVPGATLRREFLLMSTTTQHAPRPKGSAEARPVTQPAPSPRQAEATPSRTYWGDRLTLKLWILCFLLMFAMNVIDAVHRFAQYLLGQPP